MAEEYFGCSNVDCENKQIAEIVTVDGLQFLLLNGVIVRSMHGVCECGREFHFYTQDRALAGLFRRVSLEDMFDRPIHGR